MRRSLIFENNKEMRIMKGRMIDRDRAVIVAADVTTIAELENLVAQTCDVEGIEGYKIGLALGLTYGIEEVVIAIRDHTNLPVIYDHQKAGTDIPEMGSTFAKVVANSGVDAAILFPFGGGLTERTWIEACRDAGLTVLVGGHMTQKEFLESEGGFIANGAPEKIYTQAANQGVTNFVVPGNKVEFVKKYRQLLEDIFGANNFALWAPGFISQNGVITEFAKEAGLIWRAIVDSALYKAKNINEATKMITAGIV